MKPSALKIRLQHYSTYYAIACLLLPGCYMTTPPPLEIYLGGRWQWNYTYGKGGHPIEAPYPELTHFVKIEALTSDPVYDQALRLYTNGIETEAFFRQITHNSITPSTTDKKNKIIYAMHFDGEGNPAMVRYKLFFPKGKSYPDRMRINIQRNTATYDAAADTLEMEYIAVFPR